MWSERTVVKSSDHFFEVDEVSPALRDNETCVEKLSEKLLGFIQDMRRALPPF